MPAVNFQARFAQAVESGEKLQTIRRTRRANVGDDLRLYTGQRTRACRLLGIGRVTAVAGVSIDVSGMYIEGQRLDAIDAYAVARQDGFASWAAMRDWFAETYGELPFNGWLHQWTLVKGPR